MNKLQKVAINYQNILNKQYYFEIAKKQKMVKFILTFEKADFYHMAGLHKLTDIAGLHAVPNKEVSFDNIVSGNITYDTIRRSRFYKNISDRLDLLENLEDILDSNQILFKYIRTKNQNSYIEADFLLENAYKMDISFIFLSNRNKSEVTDIPNMCCRSFFPMGKMDYTKNQPSYTLLRKIKINTDTGSRLVQYDRNAIMAKIQKAASESERKSIMQQLNENKAKLAINDILSKKKTIQKDKNEHTR